MNDLAALTGLTAADLASKFRALATRPSEITGYLLDQIAAQADSHIFITVTAARAMAEAEAADRRYAEGQALSPLDGVPLAWKDLFDMAGTVTTAGSALISRADPAIADAVAVKRLAAAGMVSLGKVNTSELAYSGLGLNPHFGTPSNPNSRDEPRAPGGSSSGSGVAVASRLVCCAIGTDTGGSVRVPAAFNGVVGLKTSSGRIDKTGMFDLSRTLDTIGPLARSVEDCALLFQYLVDRPAPAILRASLEGLDILCPTNLVCDDLEPAVAANYEASLLLLERAGARLRLERVPALDAIAHIMARHGNLVAAEAYALHAELVDGPARHEIDPRVIRRLLGGKQMTSSDLLNVQHGYRVQREVLAAQLGTAVLTMPTTPIVAPLIGPLEADEELFHRINQLALRNVSLGNALDLCSLAIPNGKDANALPTSILFTALHGEDERLLALGMEIERILGHAEIAAGSRIPQGSREA